MGDDKVLRIELARGRSHENGYYYSTLDLPAEEYEIRDALQRARISGAHLNHHDLSIRYCEDISELQGLRLDAPTIDELNFLSRRIAGMDLMERRLYAAVLPHAIGDDDIVSMSTLINCTYGLDEVPVAANVSNDEQLGQFIIENELHDDVNAVPEDSVYLLDRQKIGQLYRTTYGCVYQGSLTIFAGDYEMPEVYDGQCLPENSPTQWYAFRLKLASAADAVWVELPMQKEKEAEIARQLGVSDLRECECVEFRSSVPQITAQQFGDMAISSTKLPQLWLKCLPEIRSPSRQRLQRSPRRIWMVLWMWQSICRNTSLTRWLRKKASFSGTTYVTIWTPEWTLFGWTKSNPVRSVRPSLVGLVLP